MSLLKRKKIAEDRSSAKRYVGLQILGIVFSQFLGKILFSRTAQRTSPVLGQVFKVGVFINSIVRISGFGIVLIAAQFANVDQHTSFTP